DFIHAQRSLAAGALAVALPVHVEPSPLISRCRRDGQNRESAKPQVHGHQVSLAAKTLALNIEPIKAPADFVADIDVHAGLVVVFSVLAQGHESGKVAGHRLRGADDENGDVLQVLADARNVEAIVEAIEK